MNSWPIVSGHITRTFRATHALKVAGGCATPHDHEYIARFGFRHEVNPKFGLTGSKSLSEWDKACSKAVVLVEGANLNEVMAPAPPTLEMLALFLFSKVPAYFDWVECEAYEPKLTVRVDRQRGAKVNWLDGA